MKNGNVTSWLAVIGVVVTVLTFYYSRRDKAEEEREKATTERPILSIQEGQLVSRRVGSELDFANQPGPDIATGLLTIVNHGNRVASNAMIVLGPGALSELFAVRLGDIAPNQSVQAQVVSSYPLPKYRGVRGLFEGVLRYGDKIEGSRHFEERFCFEAPFIMGVDENSRGVDRLPLMNYTPPKKVTPCGPLAHTPQLLLSSPKKSAE